MKLILICLSLLSFACQAQPRHHKPFTPLSEAQRAATVAIYTSCLDDDGLAQWRGSGVITGKHTILTAYHVVQCEGLMSSYVETLGGNLYEVQVVVDSEYNDIAKIEIVTDIGEEFPWFEFEIGPRPELGELVCSESAIPTRARKCGTVTGLAENPNNGDIKFTNDVEGGNSGSGLYDTRGRLIGIVTMRWRFQQGGLAASLWSHAEIFGTSY